MNNQIEEIISHFEKLFGITLTEINSGDFNEALNSIIGLENLLTNILSNKNHSKRVQLFEYKKSRVTDNPLVRNRVQNNQIQPKTFSDTIVNGLSNVWKKGFEKDNKEICNYASDILYDLLMNGQTSKENRNLVNEVLFAFTDLMLFSLENFKLKMLNSINKVGFTWYERWVNVKMMDHFTLEPILNYSKSFKNYLWVNLRYYVDAKNDDLNLSLISSLFDGFRFSDSYFSDSVYSEIKLQTDKKEIKEWYYKINQLYNELINLSNLTELQQWWKDYSEAHEKILEQIELSGLLENYIEKLIKIKVKKSNWERLTGFYFFNNLKELLSFVAAYALFVENYRYIYEFWHYNQPRDASAVNYGNRLLPETMHEIIMAFVKFDNNSSISEYYLRGHHEIGYYYKQYLSLLFLRQYWLPKLYVFQEFLSIDTIPNIVDFNDIESFKSKIELFRKIVNQTLEDNTLLDNLKIKKEIISKAIKQPSEILDDLISKLNNKRVQYERKAKLDEIAVKNFKKSVLDIYSKRAFYRNILTYIFKFEAELNIDKTETGSISFGIDEINIKNFLAEGDTGHYIGFVERYGHEIAYQENNNLQNKIIPRLRNIYVKIDDVNEILQRTNLTNKVIISRNIDFSYEIFQNELKDFTPKHEIKNIDKESELYMVFSGRYKGCDIFTHYDEIGWKGIMIINKNGSGKISQFKPGEKAKEEDFEGHLLFKIDAYSDDKNAEMRKNLLDNPPDWLIEKGDKQEQEKFLETQVRIQLAESILIEFDENFKGMSYTIK